MPDQISICGFVEEGVKLLGALICVLSFKGKRRIDYILAFGVVGAGFEISETFAYSDNIISSLPRVTLALRVFWLLYDGANYYGAKNGKAFLMVKTYFVTVVLHALFDCELMLLQHSDIREEILLIGFAAAIAG